VLVERMSAGAALYELPVPLIRAGEAANLTLIDLEAKWEVGARGYVSRSANSCFHGRALYGRVLLTLAGGAVAFRAPMLAATEVTPA
jgi:dihydroorotase